jgi:hypothetical protein
MAALAIAGCDVVVIIAKAINNAVDIPTAANAIATPFGMDSSSPCLSHRIMKPAQDSISITLRTCLG